jgi:O-antigen ligase
MIRILISFLLLSIFIGFINFFPVFIPHLQYAGFYFMQNGMLTYESSFIITYAELIILIIFMLKSKMKINDKYSVLLLLMPIASIPALSNAYFTGNFTVALYLFLMLCLIPFYYQFLLKRMDYFVNIKLIDYMIMSLVIAGIFNKMYQGYVHGPELAPYMHPLLYGLVSRGGGMNASNHIGGIILVLLPLISNKKVFYLAVFFLILCFSRGIYFILGLFIFYKLFKNIIEIYKHKFIKRKSFLLLIIYFIILVMLVGLIPSGFIDELIRNFVNRLLSFVSVGQNVRFSIFSNALEIFYQSNYIGVGPANFYYSFDTISPILFNDKYSNAHNMYLTLLVENGIIFLILFLYLSLTMMKKAYKYDKRILLSLSIFMFYGLFSGQLYEAGMGKVSLYDYYYYIYLIAYVRYLELKEKNIA